MYYTTSGAYRKTRIFIDYVNVILSALIVIGFVAILILRGRSGYLFPIEFLMGAVLNGLTSAKRFMNHSKLSGIVLLIIALLLLIMSIICLRVVMG